MGRPERRTLTARLGLLVLLCLVGRIDTKAGDERYAMADVADEDSFQLAISSAQVSLVLFTAPSCAESAAMRADVGLASNLLDESSSSEEGESGVAVLSVDGTRDPSLASTFGLRSFPALVVFRHSSARDTTTFSHYVGPLGSPEVIAAHMRVQAGPPCTVVHTAAQVETILLKHGAVVLGMFEAPIKNKDKVYKVLKKATLRAHHQPRCIVSSDRLLAEHYAATSLPVVMLLKRFDERRLRVPPALLHSVDDVHAFLRTRSLPLVIEYSRPTAHIFPYVLDGLSQLVVLTRWPGNGSASGGSVVGGGGGGGGDRSNATSDARASSEHFSRVRAVIRGVARHSRARIAHMMLPLEAPMAAEFLRHLGARELAALRRGGGGGGGGGERGLGGVAGSDKVAAAAVSAAGGSAEEGAAAAAAAAMAEAVVPHVVAFMVNTTSRFRYRLAGDFSAAGLKAFEEKYLAGALVPTLLSDLDHPGGRRKPRAAVAEAGELLEVAHASFDDLVLRDGVDVLLAFQAPWCAHCRRFGATLALLARRFARTPSVRIATINAAENEATMPEPEHLLQPLSFPALVFFPAHDKTSPVWYSGATRGLQVLTEFVQKHAEISFEHTDIDTSVAPDKHEAQYADTAIQCGLNQWPASGGGGYGDGDGGGGSGGGGGGGGDSGGDSDGDAEERGDDEVTTGAAAVAKGAMDDDDDDDDIEDVDDDGDDEVVDLSQHIVVTAQGHHHPQHRLKKAAAKIAAKVSASFSAQGPAAAAAAAAATAAAAAASSAAAPMNMTAVFTNKLKRRVDLYYDVKLWSAMKPGVMVSVTTYTGHRWSAQLDGAVIADWQMDSALGVQQEFDITLPQGGGGRSAPGSAGPSPSPTPVEVGPIVVDSELSLTETIKKYTHALVAFFAPPAVACEHCPMLSEHFYRAASALAAEPTPMLLVRFDMSKLDKASRDKVTDTYGIQNFPAYKVRGLRGLRGLLGCLLAG